MGILGRLNKSFLWEMNPIGQLIGWINTVWFSWHVSFSMYYEAPAGREGCVCERERVGWREGLKHPKECDDYLNSPVYCKGNFGIQSGTVQSWSFTFQKYSDPEEGGGGGGGVKTLPYWVMTYIHTSSDALISNPPLSIRAVNITPGSNDFCCKLQGYLLCTLSNILQIKDKL